MCTQVEEAKPETPKKPEDKIPTPVKETPPPPPPTIVEKPREPVKTSPPVVIEAKKEEKKEAPLSPVVVPPAVTVSNANCTTPEKKIPSSSSLEADKEVKGQSPAVTTSPVNNGNSNTSVNAAVSPPKAD